MERPPEALPLIRFSRKDSNSSKMTGEMSIPPKLGKTFRIGRRTGSVRAFKAFQMEYTARERVFTTSKATSHDMTAIAMTTHQ
jgi:hypothetical protein